MIFLDANAFYSYIEGSAAMGLFFNDNKKEYSEEELRKIRERNEEFDFGLSGKSNDDPDKWIEELSILDMIMED